jgi:hypothetical protein
MMILGIMLLKLSPGGPVVTSQSDMLLNLALTACKVIDIGTKQFVECKTFAGCHKACVSLLTSLLEASSNKTLTDERDACFVARLSKEMQSHNIVRLLVQCAESSNEIALASYEAVNTSDIDSHAIETSSFFVTIDLFIKLASIGNAFSLKLLQSEEATRILFSSPDAVSSRFMPSGGIDSSNSRNVNVIRAKLKFITICLRAVNENPVNLNDELTSHFVNIATAFVQIHKVYFLSLLDSCGNAFKLDGVLLSLDLMKDTDSFMSLIVELSISNCRHAFQVECSEIINSIRVYSVSTIGSLCMFLGASSAAREIFRAIDRMSAETLVNVDVVPSDSFSLSEQRIFAGGVQNAKHEAIRYCHFVSEVSPRTIQQFLESENRTQTMASLENACRHFVTDGFGLIEIQVRVVLF